MIDGAGVGGEEAFVLMRSGLLSVMVLLACASPSQAEPPADDVPAQLVKASQPKYPAGPFQRGVQGTVVVDFTVDEKGKPRDLKVVESIPELDEAALDCVKKWRFTPAKRAGKPVASHASAPITFRMTGRKK